MENLSSAEASLLLAVKRRPNQRLAMYGNLINVGGYIKVLHARNRLLELDMIVEDDKGLMQVNDKALDKMCAEIGQEHGEAIVVHTVDNAKSADALEGTETVQKFEDVDIKVLEMLKGSPYGRTAKELAAPFGTKGTSLNWTLRNLISKNLVVKRDTKYHLADEHDKVVHTTFERDERRVVETQLEIRTFILQQEGEFTQNALYDRMAKTYAIDKNKFCEIFSDLVLDGYYNVRDGDEYVQHDLDFSPDNLHERCVNVSSEDGVGDLLNDFIKAWESFDLRTAVRETGLRHDRITKRLASWGWDVSDQNLIVKAKHKPAPVAEFVSKYASFDSIDVAAAQQLIFGIVSISVFMKRFNLDPNDKQQVIDLLGKVGMAVYDPISGFLGPVKKAAPKPEPEEIEEPETLMDEVLELVKDAGTTEEFFEKAPEDIVEEPVKEEPLKYVGDGASTTFDVSPPEKDFPSHITNKASPLYGHPVLGRRGEQLNVSTQPDYKWIAEQPDATDVQKAMALLTRENMLDMLKKKYPEMYLEVPEPETDDDQDIQEYLDNLDAKTPLKSTDAFGFDMQEKHEPNCDDPEHRRGPCGPVGPDDSGLTCEWKSLDPIELIGEPKPDIISESIMEHAYGPQQTVNPVDQRWLFTLQMLEERFFHEHQGTTAQILREIREHLSQ